MRVYVKNKLISIRDGSDVFDENKQKVLKVFGKAFSIRKKKKVCDLNNNLMFRVQNALFKFYPSAYIFDKDGTKIARVKRKLFTFKQTYIVEGFQDEILIQGEWASFTLSVYRNGTLMGTIKREFTIVVDSFVVDAEEKDIPFMVALVIAIDNIVDRQKR